MKKLSVVLSMILVASSMLGAAGSAIVGYVSDVKCATSGSKAKTAAEWIQPAAFEECVKKCVKEGSEAVFVTEDNKILKFDPASMPKVTPLLGHKVSVVGEVKGDTLKVNTISALKLQ